MLTIFVENGRRLEISDDFGSFWERAMDLFPRDEFRHLFRQLPKLLEIYVSVRQSGTEESKENNL